MSKGGLNPDAFNPTVIGLSPLGNNQKDVGISYNPVGVFNDLNVQFNDPNCTFNGLLTIIGTNGQVREVPLVYDPISGTYSAPLSKVNQEERLEGLEVARLTQEDQRFLGAAGWIQK